jgi:tetratricopeptide (TPR) repeat protein
VDASVKLPILDLGVLAKYLLPATILAGIVAYLFLRSIVVFFWQATHSTKVQKKVGELRKPKAAPVVVRKTDLFAQLNSQQKKIYLRAKELVELQQFREAAKLFESINFQRKAIDLLESHGLIDEACAILLRMGVPYRAAVVYERNGQFLKASDFYLKDGKAEPAARCLERVAETDFNFYRRAAECYLKAGMVDNALMALSRLDASQDVLRLTLEHERYDFLQRYLDLPFHAQALLPQLTPAQIQSLVKIVTLTPQGALSLAHWTMYRPDETMILAVLYKLNVSKELAQVFWSRLDDGFCDFICGLLPTVARVPAAEILQRHAEALDGLGRPVHAQKLWSLAGGNGETRKTTLAIGL